MLYQQYRFICGECGKIQDWPMPLKPYGWSEVDGKFVCDEHLDTTPMELRDATEDEKKGPQIWR